MRRVPTQARSRATVNAIVEAARHLLISEGYVAMNTQCVATRAGVGIGSLYEYFADKSDLAQAAFMLELGHIERRLRADTTKGDPDARLDAITADAAAGHATIVALAEGMPTDLHAEVTALAAKSLEGAIHERYAVILAQRRPPMTDDDVTASAICARLVIGLVGRLDATATEDVMVMAQRANRIVRLYLDLPVVHGASV